MAATLNSDTISKITEKEKEISGRDGPVRGGPTAKAQSHVGQQIDSKTIRAINEGEQKITGRETLKSGPTAEAQSMATRNDQTTSTATNSNVNTTSRNRNATSNHSGILDSSTIAQIHEAESEITGSADPVSGGPTAQAQRHANEAINSDNLHDITEGEKIITGGERVKGGPTSTAQSELGKSRS
ncbi:hypothetical protein LTR84_009515 [Exophiala bonariae]|uniref:SMP domain-containing protein n=1 Tax=Exophiala bonariae TaxID=1690606 RepID=A0AAV9MUV5_9EURO|nr:hypothetical protein LTR84_009515 [Exophiala bonariae]